MAENPYTSVTGARYRAMTDEQLLDLAQDYGELTPAAQALLREEFQQRSLAMPHALATAHNIPVPASSSAGDDLELLARAEAEAAAAPRQLPDDPDLVTVRRYRDISEAMVPRAVLEMNGIPCFLRDENTVRIDWGISNAIGGLRLQVRAADAATAEEVLSQPMPESFDDGSGETFTQPVCPQCGSIDVVEDDMDRKFLAASYIAPALIVPPLVGGIGASLQRDDVWKCNACGSRWYDDGLLPNPSGSIAPVG